MFKLVLSFALVAAVTCDVSHLFKPPTYNFKNQFAPVRTIPRPVAPHTYQSGPDGQAHVVRSSADVHPDGSYQYAYDTSNGISAQEQGSVRALGPEQIAKTAQGSFSWTSPEGQPIQISYIADENGYQPQGDLIPTPPPVPIAIQRALDYIAAHPQPQEHHRHY